MNSFQGIGMMSGTSLDGLDLVACTFSQIEETEYHFSLDVSRHLPYSEQWRARLAYLMGQNAETYARTHVYFGHLVGESLRDFIQDHKLAPDFVAIHGHTIFHQPERNFTSQIGDGETIVSYLNCPLVANFRNKDVALGGQGAPLVPLGEKYLFPQFQAFLNLGGFANLSVKGVACDVVPCNNVLNFLASSQDTSLAYDPEGRIAASGKLDPTLLDQLEKLEFYQKDAPKSLGWEWITQKIMPLLEASESSIADKLHTYSLHICMRIGDMLERMGASGQKLLITGGGEHNLFLMEQLQAEFARYDIHQVEGIDAETVDFKEAIVFAFLGLRTLTGKSTILSSATGAALSAMTGSIHLPPQPGATWMLQKFVDSYPQP